MSNLGGSSRPPKVLNMAEIKDFHNMHQGPVAILCNGPTLQDALPYLEDYDTIGMNASIAHWPSKYWVALDAPSVWRGITYEHKPEVLFTSSMPMPKTEHVGIETVSIDSDFRKFGWSNDLTECIHPCRATVWFTMQVAAWMGYDPLLLVGFDLTGPRPLHHVHEGEKMQKTAINRQLQLMGYFKAMQELGRIETRVYNCSPISLCEAFPLYSLRKKCVVEDEPDVRVVNVGKLQEELLGKRKV